MRVIFLVIFIVFIISIISKDRASFRLLQIMLPPQVMTDEHIYLKFIFIPGYATWKLGKIRKEIHAQSRTKNNPKSG